MYVHVCVPVPTCCLGLLSSEVRQAPLGRMAAEELACHTQHTAIRDMDKLIWWLGYWSKGVPEYKL